MIIGPLPNIGAQRTGWDRQGRFALTLAAGNRLLGLSAESQVWESPSTGTRDVAWDPRSALLGVIGDTLLVDDRGVARVFGDHDTVRLGPDASAVLTIGGGRVTAVDHRGELHWSVTGDDARWLGDRAVVLAGGALTLVEPSGTVVEVAEGDFDALDADPAGHHAVGWGPHGPFVVIDPRGAVVASLPAGDRDPNTAAAVRGGWAATTGAGRSISLYELQPLRSHGTHDVGDVAHRLSFDGAGTHLLVEGVTQQVIDLAADAVRPLERPAGSSAWHPSAAVLACCDGDDLWLEVL